MRAKTLLSFTSLCFLVACGWVDSTGRSSNSSPVTQISFDDGEAADTTQLNELSTRRVRASGTDADGSVVSYEWGSSPVAEGALGQCVKEDGDFDIDIAADTLQDACATALDCSLSIDRQADSSGDAIDFIISVPDLRAPVGVTYELTTTDNEGGVGVQRSTFCLIAINVAPDAVDDSFTVLEDGLLSVGGAPERNLLTNDIDDIHVLNKPLTVLTTPKTPPTRASAFTLRDDGGFEYVPEPTVRNSDTSDFFEYWITDGVHDPVSATATITIVAKDDPPEQIDEIPVLEAVPGVPFEFDLSPFFEDPEGSGLSFTLVGGALPQSGTVTLTTAGILGGTPALFDEGSYAFTIAASDGVSPITVNVTLDIQANLPVRATAIQTQTADAGEPFALDVSNRFTDPEDQPLTYTVDTSFLDAELVMNPNTGVLRAEFFDGGRYTIDVSASDGINEPTSIRFVVNVTLDNVSPIFRGTIANQTIDLGDPIEPIRGSFSDADGQTLEFSIVGNLPTGLALNTLGVITGRPLIAGRYSGIRIVATDPFGEFARSNAFTITVLTVTPANRAPVYVEGTVGNQGILLGSPITPVEPEFTDADGDVLSYSVIGGTLPVGVTINRITGVISGTPRTTGWVRGLQVLAADPNGGVATSDEFWIRVR